MDKLFVAFSERERNEMQPSSSTEKKLYRYVKLNDGNASRAPLSSRSSSPDSEMRHLFRAQGFMTESFKKEQT